MRSRVLRWLGAVTVIVSAAAGGWWAARVTLTSPAENAAHDLQQVSGLVTQASVGRTANYNVVVHQQLTMVATNLLPGIVTSTSPGFLEPGAEAYAVANVPVRVARGSMPFYRDLEEGCKGDDVAQVQQLLVDLGFDQPVTGEWATITSANVRAWQVRLGEEGTGRIPLGTLAAVPRLPVTIATGDTIVVGAQASPGATGLLAYLGTPEFVLPLGTEQARKLPSGATVQIAFDDHSWLAIVVDSKHRDGGQTDLILAAPDGSPVCGAECGLLPAAESTTMPAFVQLVPQVTGPAVPAAAVRTDAATNSYVLLADGSRASVEVLASDNGLTIVEGLKVGDRIVVLDSQGR